MVMTGVQVLRYQTNKVYTHEAAKNMSAASTKKALRQSDEPEGSVVLFQSAQLWEKACLLMLVY